MVSSGATPPPTLAEPNDHGRVHMMVVNTESATSSLSVFCPDVLGGAHWFIVAWLIEPRA